MSHVSYPASRNDIGRYLNEKGLCGFGCEIGTAYGDYAIQILKHWRGSTLFVVDPWRKWPSEEYIDRIATCDFDAMFSDAMCKFTKYPGRVSAIRKDSNKALEMFPDEFFDFVYIDANHHEPQISLDIANWYPKVKTGGLFCGHDYCDLDFPDFRCDVKSAVDAFAGRNSLKVHATAEGDDMSWWIVKQ